MKTFREFISEACDWEKPCWIVALKRTTGASESKIKQLAKKEGWDGQEFGLPTAKTISILWELIGKKPDFTETAKILKTPTTPKRYSGTTKLTGLVFTDAHVMPMIRGEVSNFNGHGDDVVKAVVTFNK